MNRARLVWELGTELVLDKAFEKTLTQSLYSLVRAGRLDEAVQLCRKAHQPWRAASIRGSLLFQWRAIGKSESWIGVFVLMICEANEQSEEGIEDEDDAEGWQGNRRRRLWKSTCVKAALNVKRHHLRSCELVLCLYSPTCLIQSGYYMRRSRQPLKHSTFSSQHVGPGKTIYGLK